MYSAVIYVSISTKKDKFGSTLLPSNKNPMKAMVPPLRKIYTQDVKVYIKYFWDDEI